MKKITKKKLDLKRETVRAISDNELGGAAGAGWTGLFCTVGGSVQTICGFCNSWVCSLVSKANLAC